MKIAIFENEFEGVRLSFEAANLIYFDGKLDIQVFPSSQSSNLDLIDDYKVIFIDIDLSTKSILDGYGLIKKIIEKKHSLRNRIVILTGNNKIRESLNNYGILSSDLKVIIKPTNYVEISDVITEKISK